jgi:D-3-phosphoglycerate dehydrogenase / 2-oxoglutarate reductase
MNRGTVLVTDKVHPILLQGFENAGFECDYRPDVSLEVVRGIIQGYEGLIINSKILVDKYMLDKAVQLKFIGRLGSGMEIVDQVYAKEKGVFIASAPEGNRNAVGEHALGMLLALANNFLKGDREVRQKNWDREGNRGFELMGKTVGIIGFGHTGQSFAKKLAGMDVKVLAYDKYKTYFAEGIHYIRPTGMQEIFENADILSLHLPLTKETENLVDDAFINKFAKNIILINTSRGNVVKTTTLINGLKSGKIKGACLDVFENEKPNLFSENEHKMYDELYSFDNIIMTPHVAGWTVESLERLAKVVLEKILKNI